MPKKLLNHFAKIGFFFYTKFKFPTLIFYPEVLIGQEGLLVAEPALTLLHR